MSVTDHNCGIFATRWEGINRNRNRLRKISCNRLPNRSPYTGMDLTPMGLAAYNFWEDV
jgi:hypothetical protein